MLFALKNLNNLNLIIRSSNRKNLNIFCKNLKTFPNGLLLKPTNKNNLSFLTTFIRTAKSSIKNEQIKKIKKSEIRRLLSLAKPEKYKLASNFIKIKTV